jgi:Susd and RagB outer membrane lipoprotein
MISCKIRYADGLMKGFYIICLFFLSSCTKNFDKTNTPTDLIDADKLDVGKLGQMFAQAEYEGIGSDITIVRFLHSLYCDPYAQYFTVTPQHFQTDQFVENTDGTGYDWDYIYTLAAPQVHFVEKFTEKNGLPLANAVARIWKVQFYHRITDLWGPIIYSQFGNEKTSVAYDSQKDIYHDFFKTLDTAVAVIKEHAGENIFGDNDQIFSGDVDKWLIFANSLRLRLALRIAYVEPDLAKLEAEKAVAAGIMTQNSDNADVSTTINSISQYPKITYIDEFRMSATMESVMGGYEDPRISDYFAEAAVGGGYKGVRNGLTLSDRGNRLDIQAKHSFVNAKWLPLERGGTNPPIPVLHASEVYFLRAEGALRGWNMGGSSRELYELGITTSMQESEAISPAQIQAYITSLKTPKALNDKWNSPAMSDIPVAYLTAGSFEKKLEQIITQKWIAIFPNSEEAWAERRRTGYPVGYPLIESLNAGVKENEIMRRLTFSISEFTTNAVGVQAAIGLLNGENSNSTKLWWDAKK